MMSEWASHRQASTSRTLYDDTWKWNETSRSPLPLFTALMSSFLHPCKTTVMIFRAVCFCMCNRCAVNYQLFFYFCYFVHFYGLLVKKVRCAKSTFLSILDTFLFLILRCTFFTLCLLKTNQSGKMLYWVEYFKPLFTNKIQIVSLAKIGRVNLGLGLTYHDSQCQDKLEWPEK